MKTSQQIFVATMVLIFLAEVIMLVFGVNALYDMYLSSLRPGQQFTDSFVFTPPERATEINAWVQMECTDCQPTQVAIKQIEIPTLIENQFDTVTSAAQIANEVEWSAEYAPVGCDDQTDSCAHFIPPANTFNSYANVEVTVLPDQYISLLSCDITKECNRPVEQQEYQFQLEACHASTNNSTIRVRAGIDYLESRVPNSFLSSEFSDWYALGQGDCLTLL